MPAGIQGCLPAAPVTGQAAGAVAPAGFVKQTLNRKIQQNIYRGEITMNSLLKWVFRFLTFKNFLKRPGTYTKNYAKRKLVNMLLSSLLGGSKSGTRRRTTRGTTGTRRRQPRR